MSETCKHDRRRGHCDECRFFGFQPHAPTPAPDHAQAREWAQITMTHILTHPAEHSLGVQNLARAYLALEAQVEQQARMNADLVNLNAKVAASPPEGREAWLTCDPCGVSKPVYSVACAKCGRRMQEITTPPVAPLPPVVTDEMVIDALMAFNGWGGEEYEAKLRESLRASIVFRDSRAVAMRAALTAALAERPRE